MIENILQSIQENRNVEVEVDIDPCDAASEILASYDDGDGDYVEESGGVDVWGRYDGFNWRLTVRSK